MAEPKTITVIEGDGIGPEVMQATIQILEAAKVPLEFDMQIAGGAVFKRGNPSGIPDELIQSLKKTGIGLKGPLTTPVGYGEKSANVALRQKLQLFANIRPVFHLKGVETPLSHLNLDFVIVRENVEGLYTGMEYMQTATVAESLKVMSEGGCERICLLAFEFAQATGRKKVHCATKANILKISEGLLKRSFEETATRYPEIESHHIIVDNCAHQLVKNPEQFDVVVTSNMNGDILTDLASGLVGGLGISPSVNLGRDCAIFEAVHGAAPDIVGQNIANPTAMLLSAILMLYSLGYTAHANRIEKAFMGVVGSGILTKDLAPKGKGITTSEFVQAIIDRLEIPDLTQVGSGETVTLARFAPPPGMVKDDRIGQVSASPKTTKVVGVDVFLESQETPSDLERAIKLLTAETTLQLTSISNMGRGVFPENPVSEGFTTNWCCRFEPKTGRDFSDPSLYTLLKSIDTKYHWMHLEKLLEIDGQKAYWGD